tara:strand:+ start:39 stop:788 length:750 start_codon:yes stop_codon:yes gene_type:complete
MSVTSYVLLSVLIVSLISFVGIFTLGLNEKKLRKVLIYFISFSAGALFGDVFLHLLPEVVNGSGFDVGISLYLLGGIVVFFTLEKVIKWQHCHRHITEDKHVHSFAYTNLVGDGFHNLLDGVIIAAGYLVSIPAGIATTVAVALHEIPQEIGDFGVLLHGGFSKQKALMFNFISALFAFIGALIALGLSGNIEGLERILVPLAAGGFVYIAGSDLIPELHKEENTVKSILQLISFLLGIGVMYLLLFIG